MLQVSTSTAYATSSSSVANPAGTLEQFINNSSTNGAFGGITLQDADSGGHSNIWYIGSVSSSTLYAGELVFGSRTGSTAYSEWGTIAPGTGVDGGLFTAGQYTAGAGSAATAGIRDLSVGYLTSAMGAQTTATCTNITNMTWNIAASKNYTLRCEIPVTFAATSTLQFCLGGPGTATSYSLSAEGPIGAAGVYGQINTLAQTAWGTKTSASGAAASTEWVHLIANIQNGSTASGTALTLQTAANGTNAITVLADASCTLTQDN